MMLRKKLLVVILLFGFITGAFAGDLKIKVYNPGTKAMFQITSTLIYGDRDAMLIDAQFQKQYAEQLVKEIKATGKNLKTIFISHSDPDFYFGLDVIKKAFPHARVISTAQTAYLISASKDDKLAVWGPKLNADAPSQIIIPEAAASVPDLEGHRIEIKQNPDDPGHSFLWIPSLKTIAGGISVSIDSHIWLADTQNMTAVERWIRQIDMMKSLQPEQVVPSHFTRQDLSPKSLDFVKGYLENYKKAVTQNKASSDIIQYMISQYPDLPGRDELEMGVKVFTGEMKWDLKSPYPAIGRKIEADFGTGKFVLGYKDNKSMTLLETGGLLNGTADTIEYKVAEIAENVFMVWWHEPGSGDNVTHIQDYNKNMVYMNIAKKDGSFNYFKGTFTILK